MLKLTLEERARLLGISPHTLRNQERRVRLRTQARELTQRNKQRALSYLGGECKFCGDVEEFNLHFHHYKNPRNGDRTRQISYLLKGSWERLEEELQNCVILCEWCHSDVHEGLITNELLGLW